MRESHWPRAWLPLGLSLLLVVLLLVGYAPTLREIRGVWDGSETYQHGYAVLPICLWLLWRERERLLAGGFAPAWWALPLLALSGFAWLAGELAAVGALKHFALAAMLVCLVCLVWGTRAARVALFPLAFMFFAVPFGDFLVPSLMNYTADFTVAALRVTGIPVYREGLSFVIPSGNWSVIEACSGIRYLLASVMVGALYAYLTYRSPWRRLAFVAVSVVVPLIANWLRAYMIVMLGHLSGNRIAVGVDHLIYGWVFFGVVIFAMFWIGGRWREDHLPPPPLPAGEGRVAPASRFAVAAVCALLLAGIWPGLARHLLDAPVAQPAALLAPAGSGGWGRTERMPFEWEPAYVGAARSLIQSYEKDGASVKLIVHAYVGQRNGRKLLQWDNRLVADEGRRGWEVVEERSDRFELADGPLQARRVLLKGGAYVDSWHWLVVDGRPTTSGGLAKLSLLQDRLRGRSDFSAAVFVASDNRDGRARARVEDFLRANADSIEAMLDRAQR